MHSALEPTKGLNGPLPLVSRGATRILSAYVTDSRCVLRQPPLRQPWPAALILSKLKAEQEVASRKNTVYRKVTTVPLLIDRRKKRIVRFQQFRRSQAKGPKSQSA